MDLIQNKIEDKFRPFIEHPTVIELDENTFRGIIGNKIHENIELVWGKFYPLCYMLNRYNSNMVEKQKIDLSGKPRMRWI